MGLLYSKCMIDPEECLGCGICADECPQEAIVFLIKNGYETYIIL